MIEEDLRAGKRASERLMLTELHDIYMMHKKHLRETIDLLDPFLRLFERLATHIRRREIAFSTPEGSSWYAAFKQLSRLAGATLLQQKEELSPYLAEDWRPPDQNSWKDRLAQVSTSPRGSGGKRKPRDDKESE